MFYGVLDAVSWEFPLKNPNPVFSKRYSRLRDSHQFRHTTDESKRKRCPSQIIRWMATNS